MRYRPLNANRQVLNTTNFYFVSDSLGRLVTASECMASIIEKICIFYRLLSIVTI